MEVITRKRYNHCTKEETQTEILEILKNDIGYR